MIALANVLVKRDRIASGRQPAQYLRPGSIQDLGNQIQITPLESADTRVALVRLGLRIGL